MDIKNEKKYIIRTNNIIGIWKTVLLKNRLTMEGKYEKAKIIIQF